MATTVTNFAFVGPKCAQCKQPIFNQMSIAADGKIYHIYHFQCFLCHVVLGDKYTTHQGQIYCTECHKHLAEGNTCVVCNEPLDDTSFEIVNCHYHYKCFTCYTCEQPFEDGVFYPVGDEIYCLLHHWQARMKLEREGNKDKGKERKR